MMAAEKQKFDTAVAETTLSVSVYTHQSHERKCVVKNAIRKFEIHQTWYDVFDIVTQDIQDHELLPKVDDFFEKCCEVSISKSTNDENAFSANPYDIIKIVNEFDKTLKYVTILIKCDEIPGIAGYNSSKEHPTAKQNAFTQMMSASQSRRNPHKIPVDKPRFSAKDRLYNDLVTDIEEMKFPTSMVDDDIKRNVMVLVDVLWYIDGSHEKFSKCQTDRRIPERFLKYTGYNDFRKKRKAAPQLSMQELNRHAGLIFRLSTSTHSRVWGEFTSDLEKLSISLQFYASYLNKSNESQKKRQSLSHPVREVGEHSTILHFPKCQGPVHQVYGVIDQVMSEMTEYTPVYFDESLHVEQIFKCKVQRHRFIENLSLRQAVDVLTYDPGAGLGKVVYIWRVPDERSPEEMMNTAKRVHKQLEARLPEFHTREMRREFAMTYSSQVHISPHILRSIYAELTLDATGSQNPSIDARLRQAIINGDPELVTDLRKLNKGRPDDTFEVFYDQLEKEVNTTTAVDDRRHGSVQHFSKHISVRDLIEQTAKNCPEGTPIPSESSLLFAFVPKNAYTNTAKLYKGRVNLQHKVQSRQLRSSHIDEHYCAAIFKYLRSYAIQNREQTDLVCLDDKSKVDYGEPGMAIATGVRGKKSLVPVGAVLGALDHDVGSKGSLTPSVCLHVDIPEDIHESFYRGQVYVTLKDSIFKPSTPFRHAVELMSSLKISHDPKPYLLLYTDGGPDHRTTFGGVKLSLILLFKHLDLDILIAARTAPGNSWANPAERIMSLLNLAYQNVALYRAEMSSHLEQVLKSCGSMTDVRKKAEREDSLEMAWLRSLQDMISLLNKRTERVNLKGKSFKSLSPGASKEEVSEFESKVRHVIDPDIRMGHYTKVALKSCDGYNQFIQRHCIERNYIFQIRKCDLENCCSRIRNPTGVVPHFLPDPEVDPDHQGHYKSFEDVLGTPTSERDMPSGHTQTIANVAEEQQGCTNRILVAQNARKTILCEECAKPRCVYSRRALTLREERSFRRIKDRYNYTCGSLITPEGDSLHGTVFVRLQLCCTTPIEMAYYSAPAAIGRKDLCCYCASFEETERDPEALKTFRVVLPLCKPCKTAGKAVIRRQPKKF